MLMLTRRLQVLLEESQWQRLAARADRRNTSVAVLVREAIDRAYPDVADAARVAAAEVLAAEAMCVEDWPAMKAELVDGKSPDR